MPWRKRKVFVREDFRDMIEHGDFKIKDECKTWPLFSCLNTDTDAVENDGLGKAMKLSASKLLAKRYTPRSLRSGCVCQFLLNSIKSKGTVDTNDYISIKTHIGWRDEKSILAYIRTAQTKFQHVQSLLDPDAFNNPIGEVLDFILECGHESTVQESPVLIVPKRKRKAKRKILEAVTSFRQRKFRSTAILPLAP